MCDRKRLAQPAKKRCVRNGRGCKQFASSREGLGLDDAKMFKEKVKAPALSFLHDQVLH